MMLNSVLFRCTVCYLENESHFSLEPSLAEVTSVHQHRSGVQNLFFPFPEIIGRKMPHSSNTAKPCNLLPRLMSLSMKGGKPGREKRSGANAARRV